MLTTYCEVGDWSVQQGLTWGISNCHALAAVGEEQEVLMLNSEDLRYCGTAEYLGVHSGAQGVTEGATLERLRKAERRLLHLKAAGINRPDLSRVRFGPCIRHWCGRYGPIPYI